MKVAAAVEDLTALSPRPTPHCPFAFLPSCISFQNTWTFSDTSRWSVHSPDCLWWGSGLIIYFCILWVSNLVLWIWTDRCRSAESTKSPSTSMFIFVSLQKASSKKVATFQFPTFSLAIHFFIFNPKCIAHQMIYSWTPGLAVWTKINFMLYQTNITRPGVQRIYKCFKEELLQYCLT